MKRPETQREQYQGKATAELLRGCGKWPLQPHPCHLEPPWDAFDRHSLTEWDCYVNDWEAPWSTGFLGIGPSHPVLASEATIELPAFPHDDIEELSYQTEDYQRIRIEQFPEDEATLDKAIQFILSLTSASRPVAFEVLGLGPQPVYRTPEGATINDPHDILEARRGAILPDSWTEPSTVVQFVSHRADAQKFERQLAAHFPDSAVIRSDLEFTTDLVPAHDLYHDHGHAASLAMQETYCFSLRTFRNLAVDPLGVAIAAMEELKRYHWGILQILFVPCQSPWEVAVRSAVQHPYNPREFIFGDLSEHVFRDKFSSPLFAVAINVAALNRSTFDHLLGWGRQFSTGAQQLSAHEQEDEDTTHIALSLWSKCPFRPGMLLNVEELAALVHLPSPTVLAASQRLRRIETRTRPAQETKPTAGNVILGENVHRGKRQIASIPAKLRSRHCYVAGASGTGKSTLLLNMIMQDIAAGEGVGVLDPHGDLISEVLPRIPANRVQDVVHFDPTDEQFPFALNILAAADEHERERIVQETIMSLERFFPASWGPRLERILTFAIHTVLAADPNATLWDVELLLTDENYRRSAVERCRVRRYQRFWDDEFTKLPKNAVDPVLNKLSVFLMSRTVRNIVCQRPCAIDFDDLLRSRKILLANLSTGMLTEKISNVLGSFLTTKIVNAAFRRATLPKSRRHPWYLYIDEFQNFMSASIGFERILAEARKYNLCLAGLANQYVGQLSSSVRQAIYGNIGVMVVFRMGVEDANITAKELGPFDGPEIMNLDVGQAIVRVGGSKNSYNIETYPEPPLPDHDPTQIIRARTRAECAVPRREVERSFEEAENEPAEEVADSAPPPSPARRKKRKRSSAPRKDPPVAADPSDPHEDDFVR